MFFFFNDTATTEIYTLSLHDALPISADRRARRRGRPGRTARARRGGRAGRARGGLHLGLGARRALELVRLLRGPGRQRVGRSEEHTSELQSRQYLVCRLLLEKKKKYI